MKLMDPRTRSCNRTYHTSHAIVGNDFSLCRIWIYLYIIMKHHRMSALPFINLLMEQPVGPSHTRVLVHSPLHPTAPPLKNEKAFQESAVNKELCKVTKEDTEEASIYIEYWNPE